MEAPLARRVRRLEVIALGLGAALVGTLVMGVSEPSPVALRASRFELIDKADRLRGLWRITDDGSAAFTLYGDDRRARVALYAAPSGASEVVVTSGSGIEHKLRIEADGRVSATGR